MGVIDYSPQTVGFRKTGNDLIHFFADVFITDKRKHIIKTAAPGNLYIGVFLALETVGDIFYKEESEDIVLVLGSIHASAQFIAARTKGAIQFSFLYRQGFSPLSGFAGVCAAGKT
jgi:hypothetical protein